MPGGDRSPVTREREEPEQRLGRVSSRTRELRRSRIGWIRIEILEGVRFQFGVQSLWGYRQRQRSEVEEVKMCRTRLSFA